MLLMAKLFIFKKIRHRRNLLKFSYAKYFLFHPEILMWIKLRHNKDLYVGNCNLHPLLELEINTLPLNSFKLPKTLWFCGC